MKTLASIFLFVFWINPLSCWAKESRPAKDRNLKIDKYICKADADCVNSCTHGAVSRKWLESYGDDGCEDGCASKFSGPPRCIDQSCVAFDYKGKRNDSCTKK